MNVQYGKDGGCNYSQKSLLESPNINIPKEVKKINLSFKYFLQLAIKDTAAVSVSFDGGKRYKLVWGSPAMVFGKWASTGDILVPVPTDVSKMKIRFLLQARGNGAVGGWMVDDVLVTVASSTSPNGPLGTKSNLETLVRSMSIEQKKDNSGSLATTFKVEGQDIQNIEIEVYNLSGKKIFSSGEIANTSFTWHGTNSQNSPIANGVYLYNVTVQGTDGSSFQSDIRKLIILR